MARNVADGMWEMLVAAGVRRCYGIVGDALNPVIDALRRNGSVDFVHVRNEEYGAFAAVAEARLTGNPVAVCGTAGPGVVHLVNGLIDARKERAPVIAIAGDVESSLLDTEALEELNPYKFFDTAALYIGRLVNPEQLRPLVSTAITTAVAERGPVVIAVPGDVAVADAPSGSLRVPLPATTIGAASDADMAAMAVLINQADTVAIFGGDGCAEAQDEVRALAARLKAPVGYSLKGKAWLEHDNPNAVGMTGLLGYGGCHGAINNADLLLMLGTDFPFSDFLPHKTVKTIQVDRDPGHIGRRAPLELGVVGDVAATLRALAPQVADKHGDHFLREHVAETERWRKRLGHYVTKGPGIKPIRPEYLGGPAVRAGRRRRDLHRRHRHALHLGRPAHRVRARPADARLVHLGVDGERGAQRVRRRAGLPRPAGHRAVRRRRLHHGRARRPADPGPAQGPRRQRHHQQRHARLRQHRAAGGGHRPVRDRVRRTRTSARWPRPWAPAASGSRSPATSGPPCRRRSPTPTGRSCSTWWWTATRSRCPRTCR